MRYDFPTQTYTHPHRHIHTHTHLGKTLHVKDVEQYNLSAIDKEIQKYRPVLCDELFHKFIHRRERSKFASSRYPLLYLGNDFENI